MARKLLRDRGDKRGGGGLCALLVTPTGASGRKFGIHCSPEVERSDNESLAKQLADDFLYDDIIKISAHGCIWMSYNGRMPPDFPCR